MITTKTKQSIESLANEGREGCEFILASAGITSDHGPECYLFESRGGWDFNPSELHGSVQGTTNIEETIRNLGYRIVK